jgi:OCT family organic cation transporter-like MFS transporter 4/5
MLELTSSAHTSFAGNLTFVAFTVGEIIVALFAYIARDWQKLKWADTVFIGLVIPYLYFMPESPLYIYSKGQYVQLEHILRRIATQNGRKESDWYECYRDFVRSRPIALAQKHEITFLQKSYQLLTHRTTIYKLLISALIGFTTLMLYVKISFDLAMMGISPYLAILIGAIVEATSYITSSLLISTRLGRKGSFMIMMCLSIICILLIPIFGKYNTVATVCIAQLGKYAISGTAAISWIFVPELFPTFIRSTANGFFIAFGRIGAISAPIINASISKDYLPYTFYASAILAIIVLLFTSILPETKDKPLDDVPDYAVNI